MIDSSTPYSPIIVGICGGSCSGKTTLTREIKERLGQEQVATLYQDSYYKDQSRNFKEDGADINFDHPDALEFSLLAKHLDEIKAGRGVDIPEYDFVRHARKPTTTRVLPRPLVLVDGTLILSQKPIRERLDLSVFLDVPEDVRFARRVKRDTTERGRSAEGITKQFENHVKPMHAKFVQPSGGFASFLCDGSVACRRNFVTKILEKMGR